MHTQSCEVQMALVLLRSQSGGLGVLLFGLDGSGLEEAAFAQSFVIVLQCGRKDKACCPYGIDIPEVLACCLCQVSGVHQRWVPSVQKYFLCSASNQSWFWTATYC